ncbi:uncharacterized protein EI90DRAFT_3116246 [Cantharellus anzutake]|uniref:uncharacterized protein n=1 Tax=Cantharellus anzutake TaxID=1750568 RepID=UPI0019088943|nr:uncharacterized protein EI90DRAFT_3116246 [Cantharellus anzutake]KAF8342297.1 hypothetical protein EI90DRAFT_3116246 [Cantharellus anzutake]
MDRFPGTLDTQGERRRGVSTARGHTMDDTVSPSPFEPSPEQISVPSSPLSVQSRGGVPWTGGSRRASVYTLPRPLRKLWRRTTVDSTMPSPPPQSEGSFEEFPGQSSTPFSSSEWVDSAEPRQTLSTPPRGVGYEWGSLHHTSQVQWIPEHTNPVLGEQSDAAIEWSNRLSISPERFPTQESAATSAFQRVLIDDFMKLNDAIADFCGAAAESICSGPFDSVDVGALQAAFPEGDVLPSIVSSGSNTLRPLKDVIDWRLRSIINKGLFDEIFDPFHPSLSLRVGGLEGRKNSHYLESIYYSVLPEGADGSMAGAGAGTFKLLDCLAARANPQLSPIDDILSALSGRRIMPLLQAIFGAVAHIIPIDLNPLRAIIQEAYEWNHDIKSSVPSAELRTFIIPNTGQFDAGTMVYCGRAVESGEEAFICAGSIGLKLYNSQFPAGQILLRVAVLAPQNHGNG